MQRMIAAMEAASAREAALTTEVQRLGAASTAAQAEVQRLSEASQRTVNGEGRAEAPQQAARAGLPAIDTRALGRPEQFSGEEQRWTEWRTVFRAFCSVLNGRLGELMDAIEDGRSRGLTRTGLVGEDGALAAQLYYLLVLLCRGAALTIVTNAGEQEGLLAWEKLVDHYDPSVAGRQAGQLLSILSWTFGGDLQERLELFDKEVR